MDIKIIEVKKNGRTLCKINGRKYNLPNGLLKVLQNDSIPIKPPVGKPTEMIVNLDIYRTKISKEGRMLVISSDGDLVIKVKAENRIWIQAE